jgi:hypothetical protein
LPGQLCSDELAANGLEDRGEPQEDSRMRLILAPALFAVLLLAAPAARAANCDDGLDNDGDGLTDYPDDPGCADPLSGPEDPPCSDKHDNDGDGLFDWDGAGVGAADPECLGDATGRDELVAGGPGCTSGDTDGDGVMDCEDNCLVKPNASQFDADGDLCGNVCDADYFQNGILGFPGFGMFVSSYGSANPCCLHTEPPRDRVGFPDFGAFLLLYGTVPGPSGRTPGTIACPLPLLEPQVSTTF